MQFPSLAPLAAALVVGVGGILAVVLPPNQGEQREVAALCANGTPEQLAQAQKRSFRSVEAGRLVKEAYDLAAVRARLTIIQAECLLARVEVERLTAADITFLEECNKHGIHRVSVDKLERYRTLIH